MTIKYLVGVLLISCLCACSDKHKEYPSEKYFGTYITNDVRKGRDFYDSTGTRYFYCYIETTITNDSVIPMHLNIGFSNNNYQPTPRNGQYFKVFLQPKNLTDEELKKCLGGNTPPLSMNKIINPQEECVINIGFLTEFKNPLNPSPFVLFSKGHRQNFESISDSVISRVSHDKNGLDLLLGLDFYPLGSDSIKRYSVIPCGQIYFSK